MIGGRSRTGLSDRRDAAWDAGLYGAAALVALAVALFASIPLQREWARMALAPYAAGTGVAAALAVRGAGVRARAGLAVAVLLGAALLPLALEATWRAREGPGSHAQSEAIVTEEAARALLDGRDPYEATYLRGPLAARPLGTKSHFPYLPGMLAFGLPRALDGLRPLADARIAFALTDARIAFALTTLGLAALALRLWDTSGDRRLRAFQVLAVLPTGALPMATGGGDLPVLALMLLSLVLVERGKPGAAGLAAGVAAGMKQTAWLLVPFLLLAARDERRRRAWVRMAAPAAAASGGLILPFLLWNPAAFVEDVVLFPLGLGQQASPAGTPTVGTLIIRALPFVRGPVAAALIALVLAVGVYLMVRHPPESAARAAGHAALVMSLALVLAPAARFGYLIYPINLLTWARLLSNGDEDRVPDGPLRAFRGGPQGHADGPDRHAPGVM
ncbi:MAG: glycosyltransferase 87 family protein [Actinomycetota bacterium]